MGSSYSTVPPRVQLGDLNRQSDNPDDGKCYALKTNGFALDVDYPYAGGVEDLNDSPAEPISGDEFEAIILETYAIWLMWRPAGNDAIPVPLSKFVWSRSAFAEKGLLGWELDSSSTTTSDPVNTTTHPEWEETIRMGWPPLEEIPCP